MNPAHWAGFGLSNPASQPARPTMARAAAWLATRFHTAMGPAFAARPTWPQQHLGAAWAAHDMPRKKNTHMGRDR
jgi:hypothetical protein